MVLKDNDNSMKIIGLINYGMGNIGSLRNAFSFLGHKVIMIDSFDDDINSIDCFVLPGVGSFSHGMYNLKERALDRLVHSLLERRKPLIGICLGMQLLCEWSEEGGFVSNGFGFFSGGVRRLSSEISPVPNMGWCQTLSTSKEQPWLRFLDNSFYYVHSYALSASQPEVVARTKHGGKSFAGAVYRDRVFGTQFHPEKSDEAGLKLLDKFIQSECQD